jgi:hypothetical protein
MNGAMRLATTFAIGVIAVAALGATAFWALKSQGGQDVRPALPKPEFPTGGILYYQYDNAATEPPINIGSQDFEPAFDTLDDQAADDFFLPDCFPCNLYITGVQVMGEYSSGGGPASSFNVYFYYNGPDNLPGTLIAAFTNLPYTGTPPDFTIRLPSMMPIASGATYWVSVQARQDFNPNGQWFWHNRTVQSNAGAVWQNPGNGYGTGCITWERKNACMPNQVSPDQVFQILGFYEGPTPSPTATPTVTPTATPTPSSTPRPTPTPRIAPTPRSRPTPMPRP